MLEADVLMVLDRLEAAGLVAWLDGGWGVDALVGSQSRPHRDVDLVIARGDRPAVQAALAVAGFEHDPTAVPGLPARVLLADPGGRQVDLHLVVFDGQGNGWQEVGEDAWGGLPGRGPDRHRHGRGPAGALHQRQPPGPAPPRLPADRHRPPRPAAPGRA